LYVIAIYFIKPEAEKDESDHDVNLEELKMYYKVEIYDPENWEFIKSIRLHINPDENEEDDENDEENKEEKAKIKDENEILKKFLQPDSLHRVKCATNGKLMTIEKEGKLFIFDLKTGRRDPSMIEIHNTYGGYNYFTNNFWYYDPIKNDPNLISFKIDNFEISNAV
jgi:hypothetical protein